MDNNQPYRIKSFTFYDTYYELIDNVPIEDKRILLKAIFDYMFKDITPTLNGLNNAIFNNLKRPLETSIERAKAGLKQNIEQNEIKRGNKKGNTSKMLMSMSNVNVLVDKYITNNKYTNDTKNIILTWFKYKNERKECYTETGFKSLLTQIKNNITEHSEKQIEEVIRNSMASNYKGIIFNKIENKQESKMERLMEEAEERDRQRANGEIE